jgi:hypothetical protein
VRASRGGSLELLDQVTHRTWTTFILQGCPQSKRLGSYRLSNGKADEISDSNSPYLDTGDKQNPLANVSSKDVDSIFHR